MTNRISLRPLTLLLLLGLAGCENNPFETWAWNATQADTPEPVDAAAGRGVPPPPPYRATVTP